MTSAAKDLASLGSTLNAASAAAATQTTGVVAAAEDEVSAAIASLFSGDAQAYQALSAQAGAFHDQLVQALTAGARFKDVVDRRTAESMRLYHVPHAIAETIRNNEALLREAGQTHAHHIATAGGNL